MIKVDVISTEMVTLSELEVTKLTNRWMSKQPVNGLAFVSLFGNFLWVKDVDCLLQPLLMYLYIVLLLMISVHPVMTELALLYHILIISLSMFAPTCLPIALECMQQSLCCVMNVWHLWHMYMYIAHST